MAFGPDTLVAKKLVDSASESVSVSTADSAAMTRARGCTYRGFLWSSPPGACGAAHPILSSIDRPSAHNSSARVAQRLHTELRPQVCQVSDVNC